MSKSFHTPSNRTYNLLGSEEKQLADSLKKVINKDQTSEDLKNNLTLREDFNLYDA